MMSLKRRFALLILSLVFVFSAGMFLACNAAPEIKFIKSPLTLRVGDNIDAFDFVVKESGVEYSFSYKYGDAGHEVAVSGRTFCVSESGDYTLLVSAKRGNKSAEGSTAFHVMEVAPFILGSSGKIQYDLESTVSIRYLLNQVAPKKFSDTEYELYVDYVEYFADAKDETADRFELKEGVANEIYDGSGNITFLYEGIYSFHMVIENAGGSADGFFKVYVVEDLSGLDEVDAGLRFDTETGVASWNAVAGAKYYKVKINTKFKITEELGADLSDFITEDFMFFDLIVIPFDENDGKMCKIVSEDIIIAPEGYENVVLSEGTTVETSDSSAILKGGAVIDGQYKNVKDFTNDYIAFKGDYGAGWYVEVEFKGNNMPNIMFFSNDISGNMTDSDGGKGLILTNGLCCTNGGEFMNTELRLFGPNRISKDYWTPDKIFTLYAKGDVDEKGDYPLLSQRGLQNTPDDEYKYVVGTFADFAGNVYIDIKLYKINDGGNEEIYSVVRSISLHESDLGTGNILIYAEVKGIDTPTELTFTKPYYKGAEEKYETFASRNATFNDDGSVTLLAARTNSFGNIIQLENGYVGLKGNYGIGTYVEMIFSESVEYNNSVETDYGNDNMPDVLLFADNINGYKTSYGGNGIFITGGMGYFGSEDKTEDKISNLKIYGPNRVPQTSLDAYTAKLTYDEYPLFTQRGLMEDESERTYRYVVGSFSSGGYVVIDLQLYYLDGDSWKPVYDKEVQTGIPENYAFGGNIVLFAANKQLVWEPRTTFSYRIIEESEAAVGSIKSRNAVFNSDGSVTMDSYGTGNSSVAQISTMQNNGGNNYIAFDGEYGVGTFVKVKYTGNNMPTFMFFADGIDSDMTNTGGGKGLVISNGIATSWITGLNKEGIARGDLITAYGPNRISDNVGNGANLFTAAEYPAMTQEFLKNDDSGREYTLIMGTSDYAGNLYVEFRLYYEENGIIYLMYDAALNTGLAVSYTEAGAIVLYSTPKGFGEKCVFEYELPVNGMPEIPEAIVYRNYYHADMVKDSDESINKYIENPDGSIRLGAAKLVMSTHIKWGDFGYFAFDKCGVNTYMDFVFTGNNMPDVMLFADSLSTIKSSCGAGAQKGVLITGGHSIDTGTLTHYYDDTVNVYAPSSYHTDGNAAGDYTLTGYPLLTQSGLRNTPDVTYKYTVGTKYDEQGKLVIVLTLKQLVDGEFVEIYTDDGKPYTNVNIETSLTASDVYFMGRYTVVYAASKDAKNAEPTVIESYNGPYTVQ